MADLKWYVIRVISGQERKVKLYLESEIERGGWHILDAEVDAIFAPSPSSVWPKLIRKRDLKWM